MERGLGWCWRGKRIHCVISSCCSLTDNARFARHSSLVYSHTLLVLTTCLPILFPLVLLLLSKSISISISTTVRFSAVATGSVMSSVLFISIASGSSSPLSTGLLAAGRERNTFLTFRNDSKFIFIFSIRKIFKEQLVADEETYDFLPLPLHT